MVNKIHKANTTKPVKCINTTVTVQPKHIFALYEDTKNTNITFKIPSRSKQKHICFSQSKMYDNNKTYIKIMYRQSLLNYPLTYCF